MGGCGPGFDSGLGGRGIADEGGEFGGCEVCDGEEMARCEGGGEWCCWRGSERVVAFGGAF